ncbi:hypothetical protein ABGV42_01530 [Paenibacillus pabuli]|uniref:hypothetical protein n=1 Tax=Paenibacillus pabuli TaxID=1472 RepID=UPI0032429432
MFVRILVETDKHPDGIYHYVLLSNRDALMEIINYPSTKIIATELYSGRTDAEGRSIYAGDVVIQLENGLALEDCEQHIVRLDVDGWFPFNRWTGHYSGTTNGEVYKYLKVLNAVELAAYAK